MEADIIEREEVGLEDESGAPLTVPIAEKRLIGCMMRNPGIIDDIAALVASVDFFDNFHRVLFEALTKSSGMIGQPDLIELIGGKGAVIDGMSASQFVGNMIGLALDDTPADAADLATLVQECAERRAVGSADNTFLADEPFQSKMGLVTWAERNTPTADAYDELVEGVLPEKEITLIIGATQAGKSFLARHLCYCLARGVDFMGRRILAPVPVVWCAYEGGRGIYARDQAYAKATGFDGDMMLANLTRPIDLWSKDLNVEELIKEIEGVSRHEFEGRDPGVIVIDTHNAATPGASEIDSEAVSKIRDRYRRLSEVFKCAVIVIGHTNALGKMRGNEQLANNVETVIVVAKKVRTEGKAVIPQKDNDDREIRSVEIWKQREGATGHLFDFVLPSIETNLKSKFGTVRTSCVVRAPNLGENAEKIGKRNPETDKGVKIGSRINFNFFRTFWEQLQVHGANPPPELQLPRSVRCVARSIVKAAFADTCESDNKNTVESQWKRSTVALTALGLIKYHKPTDVMWWTGKAVAGMPETLARRRVDDRPDDMLFDQDFPDME